METDAIQQSSKAQTPQTPQTANVRKYIRKIPVNRKPYTERLKERKMAQQKAITLGDFLPKTESEDSVKAEIPASPQTPPPSPPQCVLYSHIVSWEARDAPMTEEELNRAVKAQKVQTRVAPKATPKKVQKAPRKTSQVPWYKSRRTNPPQGFSLEKPKKNDNIHILFLAHWRSTDFQGYAEDVHQRCIDQQQRYTDAYVENWRAFTVRKGNNLYINIRTDAIHCATDLRSTLRHMAKEKFCGENFKPIITNHLGRGKYHLTAEESHNLIWAIASTLNRDVRVLAYAKLPEKFVKAPFAKEEKVLVRPQEIVALTPMPQLQVLSEEPKPQPKEIVLIPKREYTIEETVKHVSRICWEKEQKFQIEFRKPVHKTRAARKSFFIKVEKAQKEKKEVFHPFQISKMPNQPIKGISYRNSGKMGQGERIPQADNTLNTLANNIVDALISDKSIKTYRVVTAVSSALLSVTLAIRAKTNTDRSLAIGVVIMSFFNILLDIFEEHLKEKAPKEVVEVALKKLETMIENPEKPTSGNLELSVDNTFQYDMDSVSTCSTSNYTVENLNAVISGIPQEYADMPALDIAVLETKVSTFENLKSQNSKIGNSNPKFAENNAILVEYIAKLKAMIPRKTILAPGIPCTIEEEETEEEFSDALESTLSSDLVIDMAENNTESSCTEDIVIEHQETSYVEYNFTCTDDIIIHPLELKSPKLMTTLLKELETPKEEESIQSSKTSEEISEEVIPNSEPVPEEEPRIEEEGELIKIKELDIAKYKAYDVPGHYEAICNVGDLPKYEVHTKKNRIIVFNLDTKNPMSKLEAIYPHILSEIIESEHEAADALMEDYHNGFCIHCNSIVLNDPDTAINVYSADADEDEYGYITPCLIAPACGFHSVSEGPVYDFIKLNSDIIFSEEPILEEIPEEEGSIKEGPKHPEGIIDTITENAPQVLSNIIAAVVGAITMAIACFLPGAAKVMADANTSLAFLNNLMVKGHKTQESLTAAISKLLFGTVSPEDKLKSDIINMVKELDECMTVPLDSLLDDVTFPYHFCDKIEQATQLLKDIPKGEAVSATLISSVKEARERYRQVRNALRDAVARPVPHVNMFMGLEGIGKTRASMHLSQEISKEKYQNQGIYTLACTTKYPLPLTGQKVWNIQEVANSIKPQEEFFLSNFNSIVSNMYTNIEGAAVENKMMSPQPTVINCDTNVTPEELEVKVPLGKGGTAGFLSRLSIWNVKPTWSPEIQQLPRNCRPMKADFSHLTFTRTMKVNGTWTEVDTQIGNQSYRVLTLAQVKLYTYREMEKHWEQHLPLKEEATRMLANREKEYKAKLAAKETQANGRGTDIFSVLFIGKPEQGKTFLAQELIEMLGLKWPLTKSIHTITSLKDTKVDPSKHNKPQIYFFDDCFLGGLQPDNDKKFMEMYNAMPKKSMVISTTNNAPTLHSFRPKTSTISTRFGGIPSLSYYKRYNQLFFEQGCYRRMGYHGSFMHMQAGEEQELVCDNPYAYVIDNRQIKRFSDGEPVSRDETLALITSEWAKRVVTEGVIPLKLLGHRIERPQDADISLRFDTTKELFKTTSSLTNMLMAATLKCNNFNIKPHVLEKLATAGTTPFVYHSPIKTHEDLVNYAQFFVSKVKSYIPEFTAYIEVGDTGTMYYDGTKINMHLTKYRPKNANLFVACHQIGSPVMPGKIYIYSDPNPDNLESYSQNIRRPGPNSCVMETYDTSDVYSGLWADTKELVSAIKIKAEHQELLMEFTKTKVTAAYIKDKMEETLKQNEVSWSSKILTMFTEHIDKIGLTALGIITIIAAIYTLYKIFGSDFDKEGFAIYLHHKMANKKIPESLQYFEEMDKETTAPYIEEALFKAQAYANKNNNDEYADSEQTVKTVRKTMLEPKPPNSSWYTGPSSWADEIEEVYDPSQWYRGTQMLSTPVNTKEPGYVRELESVSNNLIFVYGKAGSCYGLGLGDKLFVAPSHIGDVIEIKDDRMPGKTFKAQHVLRPENRDVAFYQVMDKTFPQFKDISHKFITSRAVPRLQNRLAIRTGVKAKEAKWAYVSGLLSFRAGNRPITGYNLGTVEVLAQFGEVECAGGDHPTDQGDCGLPYCNEEQAKYGLPSIVGIHVGAYNNEPKIIYAAVFREDIDYVRAYLTQQKVKVGEVPEKTEEKITSDCVLKDLVLTGTPKLYKIPNGNVYEEKQLPREILPSDNKTRSLTRKFCPKHEYHLEIRIVGAREKSYYKPAPVQITSKPGYNTYIHNKEIYSVPQRKQQSTNFAEATNQIFDEYKAGLGVHQPLINFETEVVDVIGVIDKTQIRSDVFHTYKRTKYADYLELDCEKRPIKNIEEFTEQEIQDCHKTTDGIPNQIAHQAKLLDEVLPKLPKKLIDLVAAEYEHKVFCTHGKFLQFSDEFTILNGITPAIDPLHPNCGAYQPININKSSGYMCTKIHKRNKKADYITMDADGIRSWKDDPKTQDFVATFHQLQELLLAGKLQEAEDFVKIVFHTSKKDELLPLEKAWKGRVFENEDFLGLLITRWVLGQFCARSIAMDIEDYHCEIGIEPMMGFDRLARKHLEKPCHFAGDISRHDKRCPYEFFEIIMKGLIGAHKKACKTCKKGKSCGWPEALRFLIKHISCSKRVILNMLVQLWRGMPSGSYVTGPVNSEIVYLFYFVCYVVLTGNVSMSLFEEQVVIDTCGDDHLLSIDESIAEIFNLKTCQKVMRKLFGVQLDSDRKDGKLIPYTRSIDGLSFMSRFFVQMGNSNHYMGALKKESITAKLFYIRKTAESDIQYQTNFRMAIVEAAPWGVEYYNKIMNNILYAISEIPSPDCCYKTIYMNYNEIIRSYLGYCLGQRDLISYTVLPKIVIQSAIMDSVSQINIKQQKGVLHLISNEFQLTPKGLWECTIKLQLHDSYGTILVSTRQGSSKAVAKEAAARDILVHMQDTNNSVGKVTEGIRQPQMLPTPTPSTSGGGGGGIMQVLPQQPLTNPLSEATGELLPAQKVDDREASTATANGGILNQQLIPTDFSHNAITAFFSGVHPYITKKITTKTPEGDLLLSADIQTLLSANAALNSLISLHNYVQYDVVVKQRTVGPVGMTGEIMIALVPSDAVPYLTASTNAMAAIKRMYEYEIVGIQGNTARTTRLAKIVNAGFASARTSSNNQTSDVTLLVYLHTAISTTFAEPTDTSVINYYVEFTLGENFDMSMPIAPLESIIAPQQSQTPRERPQNRAGGISMSYPTGTRFMVGGKIFGNLTTLAYLKNRTPLPYFFAQNGDNVTTGRPGAYNAGQWRSGNAIVMTTQPIWHSGDIPTSPFDFNRLIKYLPNNATWNEKDFAALMLRMLVTEYNAEVYIVDDPPTIPNFNAAYVSTYISTIGQLKLEDIEASNLKFKTLSLAIVTGNGTTFLTLIYIVEEGDSSPFRYRIGRQIVNPSVQAPYLELKVPTLGLVHTDRTTVEDIIFDTARLDATVPYLMTSNDNVLTNGTLSELTGYRSGAVQGYYNSSLPVINVANTDTRASTILASGGPNPIQRNFAACGFSCSNMSYSGTKNTRGFIPTTEHWQLCARLEDYLDQHNINSVTGILELDGVAVGEVNYDYNTGLTINTNDTYVSSSPITNVSITSLKASDAASLTPTVLAFPSYYIGTEGTLRTGNRIAQSSSLDIEEFLEESPICPKCKRNALVPEWFHEHPTVQHYFRNWFLMDFMCLEDECFLEPIGSTSSGEKTPQAAMAIGAAAQAAGGMFQGIGSGINAYVSDKRTREENQKDRELKEKLQQMVNEGQLTLAEANARFERERTQMNIDNQQQLQAKSHSQQEHMARLNQELDIEKHQENLKSNRANAGIINAATSTGVPSASWGNSGWDTPAVRRERRKDFRELPNDVSRNNKSATTVKGTNKVARSKIVNTLGSLYVKPSGESNA